MCTLSHVLGAGTARGPGPGHGMRHHRVWECAVRVCESWLIWAPRSMQELSVWLGVPVSEHKANAPRQTKSLTTH